MASREANAIANSPAGSTTFAACFSHSPSWIARWHFASVAGPGSHAPCPWHGHSCRGIPQRHDAILLRTRDVPQLCCARLSFSISHVGRKLSASSTRRLDSGRKERPYCFNRERTRWPALRSNQINIDRVADTLRLGRLFVRLLFKLSRYRSGRTGSSRSINPIARSAERNQPFAARARAAPAQGASERQGLRNSPTGQTVTRRSRSFDFRGNHPTADNQAIALPIALRTFTALKKSGRLATLAGRRQLIVHLTTHFASQWLSQFFLRPLQGCCQPDVTAAAPPFAPARLKPRSIVNYVPQDGRYNR